MKKSVNWLLSILLATGSLWGAAGAAAYDNQSPEEAQDLAPEEEIVSASMTYRDNSVILQGADGISIAGGSFQVKEFSITPGQDPDGKNYIGQTHTLNNGEFTFEVGRKASDTVASWFNTRMSGYNDSKENGDRTTFDQTAGSLNFAFIGDLVLTVTTAAVPQGTEVTFADVAIAQGSSGLRNNWWFGQKTGQHTRDSDGPNRMLAIGTDNTGHTVYASFLRGGNGVNVISLEALYVPDAATDRANKIPNVRGAFQALPVNGSLTQLKGFPGSYDPVKNHIQGYAQYDNPEGERYALLTHSVSSAPYAHVVAGKKDGSEKWGFKTYLQDWRHPGGIQVIGDYLMVPSEQDTNARVAMYDLRSLPVQELRRVESFDLAVNHKAGALGITSYADANGTEYYLMIVAHLNGADSVYYVYRAPAAGGLEQASFTQVGSFGFDKDFQGFGLVTEEGTNDIYMIGLWSPPEGASYADYAYLYKLDKQNWTIGEELEQIHMVSTGGGVGVLGTHFRYGAGVFVTSDQKLILSATERNSTLGSPLATNDWVS